MVTLQVKEVELNTDEQNELRVLFGGDSNIVLAEIKGYKPNYEVGASSQLKLSFAKPVTLGKL